MIHTRYPSCTQESIDENVRKRAPSPYAHLVNTVAFAMFLYPKVKYCLQDVLPHLPNLPLLVVLYISAITLLSSLHTLGVTEDQIRKTVRKLMETQLSVGLNAYVEYELAIHKRLLSMYRHVEFFRDCVSFWTSLIGTTLLMYITNSTLPPIVRIVGFFLTTHTLLNPASLFFANLLVNLLKSGGMIVTSLIITCVQSPITTLTVLAVAFNVISFLAGMVVHEIL